MLKKHSDKKQIHIVTHFNHPNELRGPNEAAVKKLIQAGIPVHNQAVLLKGVNDNPKIIVKLLQELVAIGVNPYYIFQCRPVTRTTHFQVPIPEGYQILEDAKKHLSGPAKRFKYIMSHYTGKIEIVYVDKSFVTFKYHQARDPKDLGRMFRKRRNDKMVWLAKNLRPIIRR